MITSFILYLSDLFAILSASSVFPNSPKHGEQVTHPQNQFRTLQKDHFISCKFLLQNEMIENMRVTTSSTDFVTSCPIVNIVKSHFL